MISTAEMGHKETKPSFMECETRTQVDAFQEEERMTHLMEIYECLYLEGSRSCRDVSGHAKGRKPGFLSTREISKTWELRAHISDF